MPGNDVCDEIHHRAHRRSLPQVAVNHEPDIARKGRDTLADADEIARAVAKEARQPGHADAGLRSNQMFADMVELAGHRPFAGNAEQPSLLRHLCKGLIEGNELPSLGRPKVSVGPMRIEAEGHGPELSR